jgi:hypothetical protein
MVDRTPRQQTTREATERKRSWQRSAMIPAPEPRDGLKFRWIRTSSMGQSDNTNVSRRFREGYTPVKAEDFPELQILSDVDSRFKGNIEVGGLLLCSIPEEYAQERIQGQLEEAQAQIMAVDNNYMRENDPRMPLMKPERTSRTSFGRR